MSVENSIKSGFREGVNFSGRASRSEYWYFFLFFVLVYAASSIPLRVALSGGDSFESVMAGSKWFMLPLIVVLVFILPIMSLSVRRLHDIDRMGWWVTMPIGFGLLSNIFLFASIDSLGRNGVPVGAILCMIGAAVSSLVLLAFYCMKGTDGANRFGVPSEVNSPSPMSSMQVSQDNVLAALEKLADMRMRGVLTEEEFLAQKKLTLAGDTRSSPVSNPATQTAGKHRNSTAKIIFLLVGVVVAVAFGVSAKYNSTNLVDAFNSQRSKSIHSERSVEEVMEALRGDWASDSNDCEVSPNNGWMSFEDGKLYGYEWGCEIPPEAYNSEGFKGNLICSMEGNEFRDDYQVVLFQDDQSLHYTGNGNRENLERCSE